MQPGVRTETVAYPLEQANEALDDLRERVLEPLSALRPATAERLAETLRSWLLHHGRRDDVAAGFACTLRRRR